MCAWYIGCMSDIHAPNPIFHVLSNLTFLIYKITFTYKTLNIYMQTVTAGKAQAGQSARDTRQLVIIINHFREVVKK